MANNTIDIKEDASPTKKLASQSFTRGVDTVHQEEVVIGDGTTDGRIATVTAANALKVDGSAVTQPVSDGGGAVTVDALDLDIRNLSGSTDKVRISDGTFDVLVTSAGELNVRSLPLPGTELGNVQVINDAGNAVNVQAVDFDVRNLTPATDEVKVSGQAADGVAVAGNPVRIGGKDGSGNTQDIATDAAGELQVDVLTLPSVTIGTFPDNEPFNLGQVGGTATVNGGVAGSLAVGGHTAHDAGIAGNPVLIGGMTETPADSAPANRVSAEGDLARLALDPDGSAFVLPHGPQIWSYHENSSSALTDTSVHAAPGAGLSLYVTDIIVSTGAATALNIFFEEGSTTVLGPYYLEAVAGRGLAIQFRTPKKITANTALTVTTSAAIAHGIDVMGYVGRG